MHWCFALINKRLAEIFFEGKNKSQVVAYCYVKAEEYKTKKEKNWIAQDTKRLRFLYKKGKYKRLLIKNSG